MPPNLLGRDGRRQILLHDRQAFSQSGCHCYPPYSPGFLSKNKTLECSQNISLRFCHNPRFVTCSLGDIVTKMCRDTKFNVQCREAAAFGGISDVWYKLREVDRLRKYLLKICWKIWYIKCRFNIVAVLKILARNVSNIACVAGVLFHISWQLRFPFQSGDYLKFFKCSSDCY